MSDFLPRILTGLTLVIVITGAILAGAYSFMVLVMLIGLGGLLEFYRLFALNVFEKIAGTVLSLFLFLSAACIIDGDCPWQIILLNVPLAFSVFVAALYIRSDDPFKKIAFTFLGIIYITVPCIFLICLAYAFPVKTTYAPMNVLGLFLIVWSHDSGAYITGKLAGKHKLFYRISPNKTWEGSIGGAVLALLAAFIIFTFSAGLVYADWFIVSLIIIVTGTFGDFVKSLMKRSLKIKDTGTILPGHGGILDRFDSLLSSAPFVYCYLILTLK